MYMTKELSDINVQSQMKNYCTKGTQYPALLGQS